jgi:hypothetical protein
MKITPRTVLLLAGALGAGLKAADLKQVNPILANALIIIGTGLAWVADQPRSQRQRGRVTDHGERRVHERRAHPTPAPSATPPGITDAPTVHGLTPAPEVP